MCSSRRGLARILVSSILLVAELAVCGPASGQGGGKPKPPPPPDIPRPICFWASQPTGKDKSLLCRADVNGTSIITVNTGVNIGASPRWSPDGSMIGGYYKSVGHNTSALMVMSRDGANEEVVMTMAQFDAWNLARPGVVGSRYVGPACWLGNNAFVFGGWTTYDASFFGGTPGTTWTDRRLFIVDATGTITPLTETAALDETYEDRSPHWSAALNKIVFVGVSKSAVGTQLYAINPDGTGLADHRFRSSSYAGLDASRLESAGRPTGHRCSQLGSLDL